MTKRNAAVFLWFDTEAEAAAEFYAAAFRDPHVDNVVRLPEGAPNAPAGIVQVVEMTLLGLPYVLLNACPQVRDFSPRSTMRPGEHWLEETGWAAPGVHVLGIHPVVAVSTGSSSSLKRFPRSSR